MGANRAMRRQQEREQVREWRKQGEIGRATALMRNGITKQDLKKEYDNGHEVGFERGAERALKMVYSAIVIELLNAGNTRDEAISFLRCVDTRVMTSIDADEDITEVLDRTGVKLELKSELERVQG